MTRIVNAEYTDTYAGEANYGWVRRATFELPANATDLQIVRAAKKRLGLAGVRCTREDMGDTIVLRPLGSCTVLFVN